MATLTCGVSTNGEVITQINTNTDDIALKADKTNVLELDNTDVYTPTLDYHPATKKYTDDGLATAAKLGEVQTFTASQRGTVTTDNDGSFDMNVTNKFKCTPTATFALTFTNLTAGQGGVILLDNSGGYTITKDASVLADSAFLTTISAVGKYVIGYECDGTNVWVTSSQAVL